jgi:hypothetical protein
MILFVHAAAVSLAATQASLQRARVTDGIRHALLPGLVDTKEMRFALGDGDFSRLLAALAPHVRGDETRIVLSCSVYNGFAPQLEARLGRPVERSDDAGTRSALARGGRIALAVSYPPSYPVIESHVLAVAAENRVAVEIEPLLSENAFAFAGESERYAAILGDAVERARDCDVIFFAQFSMDPYVAALSERPSLPVVSALESCVRRLFAKTRN